MSPDFLFTPLFDTLECLDNSESQKIILAFLSNPSLPKDANQDYRYAKEFLYSYRGSEATFSAYRRELERLLHWAWQVRKQSLTSLRRPDIENYIEFCKRPHKDWIGTEHVARFILQEGQRVINPKWRPFIVPVTAIKSYQLSQKALQAIFGILSSFYNYLIQENYAGFNPIAQIRQKSKFIRKNASQKMIVRRLSLKQWSYVLKTAEQMALENPLLHERTLFMLNALYSMYLRISELAASKRWEPQMGHFQQDSNGSWWFLTVGKGNKERMIVVSDDMLAALRRYRQNLGLSPLPLRGESLPLLPKNRGTGGITSTRQIRLIIQSCFDRAMDLLKQDGFSEEAEQLKAATVHWLRHTGISEDVKIRPREHVRDDAGHSSSLITDRYIDVELRERHASGKNKKIK